MYISLSGLAQTALQGGHMTELDWEIIHQYADHDMSVSATAKAMYMHENTIRYHLEKTYEVTGMNPRKFHDLVKLLNAELVEKAVNQISKELFSILRKEEKE
jgi:sugar diacid utilization regulator